MLWDVISSGFSLCNAAYVDTKIIYINNELFVVYLNLCFDQIHYLSELQLVIRYSRIGANLLFHAMGDGPNVT